MRYVMTETEIKEVCDAPGVKLTKPHPKAQIKSTHLLDLPEDDRYPSLLVVWEIK